MEFSVLDATSACLSGKLGFTRSDNVDAFILAVRKEGLVDLTVNL